ncbi:MULTISPECIES: hypothetical protein [unclassified Streptomyces]|uniref:hypothetical protein n=1 Tax=unclassified Streptomyces TaxID=2593676 RepID=UPI0009394A8D|nr:hypothetical protein [Streptomyces sp. TSRI0281]OKI41251.1 hypothetical protein A6A29_37920 [Streptomyces sp. TSRI0281]
MLDLLVTLLLFALLLMVLLGVRLMRGLDRMALPWRILYVFLLAGLMVAIVMSVRASFASCRTQPEACESTPPGER